MRFALLLVIGLCTGVSTATAQGVVVSLTPADTVVTLGDEFELQLRVTQAGPEFNAYDAIISYDTNALTFLQQSPVSLQEGSYMKSACGLTFHLFSAQDDSLSISHSLLCGTPPVFLTGPGVLYKLRFQTSMDIQTTEVEIRYIQFFRAGVFVDLQSVTNAIIHIGETTSSNPPPLANRAAVVATPNPFNPQTVLHLTAPADGQQVVRVWDVRGHLVRRLQTGWFPAGTRRLPWDGRTGSGEELGSGVYLVTLDLNGTRTATRVVLVR
jgi:hypothetical protein